MELKGIDFATAKDELAKYGISPLSSNEIYITKPEPKRIVATYDYPDKAGNLLCGFVIDKEFFYPVRLHSGRMVKKSHLGKDYFFRIGGFAM